MATLSLEERILPFNHTDVCTDECLTKKGLLKNVFGKVYRSRDNQTILANLTTKGTQLAVTGLEKS